MPPVDVKNQQGQLKTQNNKMHSKLSTSASLTHWEFKHSHWEKRDAFSVEIPTDCPEQPFRSTLGSMFCRR